MIQLSGAGKRFGPKILFENLDWLITPHDRVGLLGIPEVAFASGLSLPLRIHECATVIAIPFRNPSLTSHRRVTPAAQPQ